MATRPFRQHILLGLALGAASISAQEVQQLPEVVVTGKAEDLLGQAPAASKGQADAAELNERPYLRRSEILETVPGLVTTQHAGGGKATQYFLRGFNLDHGTDFSVNIDRMPVNMRTHAHGQGYADLNFLIPEFIERLDYVKGTYTTRNGDLSTAGSADFKLWNALPRSFAKTELGEHEFYRAVLGHTFETGGGKLTLGGEFNYNEGPWVNPEDFRRWNGLARWFRGDEDNHFSLTAMSGSTRWTSSDQLAQRAVRSGLVDRLGTLDETTGGDSQRHSLQVEWQQTDGDVVTRLNAYGLYYDLGLYSNFTYFLDDPERGDQFEQSESRWVYGGEWVRTWKNRQLWGHQAEYEAGLQTRHDVIDGIGLFHTRQRDRLGTVRQDDVYEGNLSAYVDSTVHWNDWLRTTVGLRGDLFDFDVSSDNSSNSGEEWDGIVSPKLGLVLGPWHETEFYANFGTGFHSNDARGVNTTVDPVSGDPVPRVDPLVRTMGAELGVRTQAIPDLTSTLALWWLDSDSELVYVGDAGTNEAGPASRRFGVEWTGYWRPSDWFRLDAEVAATLARFVDAGEEDHIPNSIPWMCCGGVTLGREEGFFGGLRVRAFAPRPLEETGEIEGKTTCTLNGQIGYRKENWELSLECLNLLGRDDNDIEYYYTSRLPGERSGGYDDVHAHPAEPRMFRVSFTYRF